MPFYVDLPNGQLCTLGMRPVGSSSNQLSQEGAAELYWEMFIERLQR
jgi:hypothetical protein